MNSPTIKFYADFFPAHRCPCVISNGNWTEWSFVIVMIKFQIRPECASVNRSNVLLIFKSYFPANKMNRM